MRRLIEAIKTKILGAEIKWFLKFTFQAQDLFKTQLHIEIFFQNPELRRLVA
jgi:hypothetical protein